MSVCYRFPAKVKDKETKHHPALSTRQGGRVALDRPMLALWCAAGGKDLDSLIMKFGEKGIPEIETRAALASLTEAGLLVREGETEGSREYKREEGELVSVIIVSYNSRTWLQRCLSSIADQTYSPVEVIIVDNASEDGSPDWIDENCQQVILIRLPEMVSLAGAINRGVAEAAGAYYFLLNPDVELKPDVITQLVMAAQEDLECAAVAAKLKFSWAPAFLNGLGNFVGAFSWGTDFGLGHLDLGQYDGLREVPSACFAAALIPASTWKSVGALDEGFFLYYEDSEWCYRARMFGYRVRVASQAVVFHAFGGPEPTSESSGMRASKYHQVTYGRLRFITKLLSWKYWLRFVAAYLIEDCFRFFVAVIRGRFPVARAFFQGWNDFIQTLPEIRRARRDIQNRRVINDRQIFNLQRNVPVPLIWHGVPLLTWDIVRNKYLQQILSGKVASFPEFPDLDRPTFHGAAEKQGMLKRTILILRAEGLRGLLQRVWRYTQWRLMRP